MKISSLFVPRRQFYIFLPLVIVHIGFFVYLMMQPLYWTNEEVLWQGFFWSMDGWNDFHLHTGLQKGDWIKIFHTFFIDGTFRTRQFSYLLEMLSFKFWQPFGLVLIKNFTLIGLHVLNAFLLGLAIFRLRNSAALSCLTVMLFLNSGAGLATLMYPFRNAKILAVTLFLLAWVVSLTVEKNFKDASARRIFLFFSLIFLALLTDEIAFFLSFLLLILLGIKEGWGIVKKKRFIIGLILVAILYVILYHFFLYITTHIEAPSAETGRQQYFLRSLPGLLANLQTYQDVAKAFTFYFLRKNFGFWSSGGSGLAAAIAAGILFVTTLWHFKQAALKKMILAIGVVFILKAFLLPHNAGFHHGFMPEGTFFPSLLFFSYYYIYCEAMLVSLFVGLLLEPFLSSPRKVALVFVLVALISFSNVIHLRAGPADALNFMYFDKPHRQKLIKDVLKVENLIRNPVYRPLFLSFPAGETDVLMARREDAAPPFLYGRIIPIRYLRWFEKGELVVYYPNVPSRLKKEKIFESVKYFYDVKTGQGLDLGALREQLDSNSWQPMPLVKGSSRVRSLIKTVEEDSQIIFLIRGSAYFSLRINDEVRKGIQTYGNTYEMFQFSIKEFTPELKILLSLNIQSLDDKVPGELLGPWIVSSKYLRTF